MYIHKVVPNLYRDSVSLMQLSAALAKLPGVEQASAIMATPANLALLREAKLLNEASRRRARTICSSPCAARTPRRSMPRSGTQSPH